MSMTLGGSSSACSAVKYRWVAPQRSRPRNAVAFSFRVRRVPACDRIMSSSWRSTSIARRSSWPRRDLLSFVRVCVR
jgi:hypothetical protein